MTTPFPSSAVFSEAESLTRVGGVDVRALAQRYGTPLYVLDETEIRLRVTALRAALGEGVAVAYAAKALCVTGVLQLMAQQGLHLDVASAGELHTALRAGFPAERILFHGNNKSVAEIEMAAESGVGRIVVDSLDELRRLEAVGARRDHHFDALVRITPGVTTDTHEFIRTGHDQVKFGFPITGGLAAEAIATAARTPHVRLLGLHCHLGSQITDARVYREAARRMCALLESSAGLLPHATALRELNLGGGLGIAYGPGEAGLELDAYADAVLGTVSEESARRGLGELRLTVEPGRWLVGNAGITIYEVGTVKRLPGQRFVSVDGGMSDNLRPALYRARYSIVPAGGIEHGVMQPATVVGKHCETGDVLATDARLPDDLAPGDLLAVAATGAYGYAMASNYNRLPRPAMVLLRDGRAAELVRRETLDELVARDVPLPPVESVRISVPEPPARPSSGTVQL